MADIWFESSHDDTFGVLNATPYAKRRPPLSLLADAAVAGDAGTRAPPAPTVEERESQWAAGYRAWLPVQALEVLRDLWGEFRDG